MGDFPPYDTSAWNLERNYEFSKSILKFGFKNQIIIKVNDNGKEGGIVKGPVEIVY